jgi:Na+/melibiose symporter-like transporter
MFFIIVIVVIALIIMMIEVPSLLKKKQKKELWAFSILLVFATGISILHVQKVDLPNPHDWIAFIYKPLSDMIYSFLK